MEVQKGTTKLKSPAIIERPRICCIDLTEDITSALKKTGANISEGTLGSKVKVLNSSNESRQVLLNFDFPKNLHEFDIIIVDLDNYKTIDYKLEEHVRKMHTGKALTTFLSSYPETLFDPRPLSSFILGTYLHQITNRQYLVLAFSSEAYDMDYEPVEITEDHARRQGIAKYNIYSFWDYIPVSVPKFGREITIKEMKSDLQLVLEKYKDGTFYNQTFHHPTIFTDSGPIDDKKYFPLMTNLNGDIISYTETTENGNLFILPQIKDKSNFLLDFLTEIAPSYYPALFPFSTTFNWKKQEEYWLPKHSSLIKEKIIIEKEFQKKLEDAEKKIEDNLTRYSFLHEIISETGDMLTNSLIRYFKWLEFDNVVHYDITTKTSNLLEEDIQVKLPDELLIIECKGIGGTSTDSDCGQISKIKHRRCKERGKFDVYALYIVNHQRYQPPLKRQNPPFSENQIQDAKNDERGLLSTWQLFKLYNDIENGIITKEEARKSVLGYGLVEFRPSNLTFIYEPNEIFHDGQVCIVDIDNITLKTNDELLIEKNGRFEKVRIIDIKENNNSVSQASKGEIGLKLSGRISKKSTIWKKEQPL